MQRLSNLRGYRIYREAFSVVVRQISMILVALLMASLFLALSHYDPLAIMKGILGGITKDLAGTIRWSAPLILAGLAISITFKAQVFNLGVDGQIYIGAAAATAVALILPPAGNLISIIIVLLTAMVAGGCFALIPAALKVYFDTNEVVSTLLLNFIAVYFITFLVSGPLRDPATATQLNASKMLPEHTWLPRLEYFAPSAANAGIYLAIGAAIAIAFLLYKTKLGHEVKIVGANSHLALYSGMKPKSTTMKVMMLSGSLGGMIGATEVMAVQHKLLAGFNPDFGFDGIVVSLLANNNPIGVIFSGIFFGLLRNGGINMERLTDVPSTMTDIVMAIVILTISAQIVIPKIWKTFRKAKGKDPLAYGSSNAAVKGE